MISIEPFPTRVNGSGLAEVVEKKARKFNLELMLIETTKAQNMYYCQHFGKPLLAVVRFNLQGLKFKRNKMDNKHELTEKLKVIETEIYDAKIDLRSLNSKLENAYKYEEELLQRIEFARKQTKEIRESFFIKAGEISDKYENMKIIFDVFTGNFYKHNVS